MPSAPAAGYRSVLRIPAAVRPFGWSLVARLPISMAPIGALLLIQSERGSYGLAGAVTGSYALGTAAGSPLWARLAGGRHRSRVLALTSLASAAALALLAVGAVAGAPLGLLLVVAAVSGVAFPPVGPAMRLTWAAALPAPAVDAGYALDAAAVESIFVGGPLLLSLLLLGPAALPLLVTAGMLLAGGLGFARDRAVRAAAGTAPGSSRVRREPGGPGRGRPGGPGRGRSGRPGRRRPRTGPLAGILAVAGAMSVGFGHLDTSLAATARGAPGGGVPIGVLFTAIAGGSATGGLLYGARRWPGRRPRQLVGLLGLFAAVLVAVTALSGGRAPLPVLLAVLFATGLPIAPSLIIQQAVVDALSPPGRSSAGQGWLTSASTAGAALGTAVAGVLIDARGVAWGFAGGCGCILAATAVAAGRARAWSALPAFAGQQRDQRGHRRDERGSATG